MIFAQVFFMQNWYPGRKKPLQLPGVAGFGPVKPADGTIGFAPGYQYIFLKKE
jgi:hypothetical protein